MNGWPVTISLPHGLTIGGVTSWAVRLAESLSRLGRKVRLVAHAPIGSHEHASLAPRHGVELVRAPRLTDEGKWTENLALYRRLTPTVLLPNLLDDSFSLAAALASVEPDQMRVVAWNHSDNPYDYAHLSCFEPLVHEYVCVSQRCLHELRRRLPHRDADIALLPYGVPDPGVARRLPMAGRPIRLLYAGRFEHTTKRVLHLVELARRLDEAGAPFELRFVGEGPQQEVLARRCEKLTAALKTPACSIRILPAVDFRAMVDHWRWADVAVLASAFEGFSVAMIEAMMSGCIPLVSRVRSGVDDIIVAGENGLTFPVDDLEAMTRHVLELRAHPQRAETMAHNARAAALRACDYGAYVERVRQILDRAAHAPQRPWPRSRPISMRGQQTIDPSIPGDAPARLRTALAGIAAHNPAPAALFGAGRHTRSLADVLSESPLDIRAVIDESPELWGKTLWGWPIVPPEHVAQLGVRHVVISSYMHEQDVYQRYAARFTSDGIQLHRLYAAPAAHAQPPADGRSPGSVVQPEAVTAVHPG